MNSNNLILIFLAFLTMGFGKAGAQEVSTLSGWAPPQGAVVRQYIDNQSIYYFDDGTNHYFVLFDKANPSSAIVSQFPTDLELHDFEVYNKVVYFCGKQPNAGNPLGMVGQISVNDLFYTNQPYNIGLINQVQSSPPPTYEHLTSCDRMDVFEDAGQVHLAIVAEMEHGQGYGYTQRRTACDIWFNGISWQGSLHYQRYDNNILVENLDDWEPVDETVFPCSGIPYPIFYPNPSNGNITTLCPSNKNITK